MAARSIPVVAGLRSVTGTTQRWHLVVYLAIVVALLMGFATSSFEPPFQRDVQGATLGVEVSPATWSLASGNLLPGASATAAVEVRNPSGDPMRLSLTLTSSGVKGRNLGDALYMVLKTVGDGCERFDGQALARGALAGFRLGDPTPGQQPGDWVLGPGASQTLCLRALVPVNTGNDFQGASTILRLILSAEGVTGR